MRSLAVLWLLGAALVACDGPVSPGSPLINVSDSALTDSVRAEYREDAAVLTLRLVGPDAREVELPEALTEQLYRALVAVHNATDLPAHDTVVDLYRVHAFGRVSLRELILGWDSTASWPDAWKRGQRLTGNARIDELMTQFDLWPRRVTWCTPDGCTYPETNWLVLRAERPLHTGALGARFEQIPGVRYAEPNGAGGDGNNITAQARDTRWHLSYSVGYGDCPAGCINRRHWDFEVDRAGTVSYLGSRGDPPPP